MKDQDQQKFDRKVKLIIIFTVLFVFVFLNVSIVLGVDLENNPTVAHLLGIIDMAVGIILNYYWGSSKGSKDKDDKNLK